MDKVYTLPDLLPAATSEIGTLARRLIEYADLSAARPLLDALEEAGRREDANEIRRAFGYMMSNRVLTWNEFIVVRVGSVLWFDIFDLTESLAALERRLKPKAKNPNPRVVSVEAGAAIRPDQLLVSDAEGRAVPIEGVGGGHVIGAAVGAAEPGESVEVRLWTPGLTPPPAGGGAAADE